jgi:hypothetical protein
MSVDGQSIGNVPYKSMGNVSYNFRDFCEYFEGRSKMQSRLFAGACGVRGFDSV